MSKRGIAILCLLLLTSLAGCSLFTNKPASPVTFNVRIENVSTPTTLMTSSGEDSAVPLAPGVWVIHTADDPLFTEGSPDYGDGLEPLAEDGNPVTLGAMLLTMSSALASGVFNTPVGASDPGPIGPGGVYEFTVTAMPGQKLSFATMFVPSNDLFYAPSGVGIALFDAEGNPVSGDVTGQVYLWDAGTEINQEPGAGSDQAPNQPGPNTGADEHGVVQRVSDPFNYPLVTDVIMVTITRQ